MVQRSSRSQSEPQFYAHWLWGPFVNFLTSPEDYLPNRSGVVGLECPQIGQMITWALVSSI